LTLVNAELCISTITEMMRGSEPAREVVRDGEGQKINSSPSGAYNRRHFLRALGGASAATVTVVIASAPVAEAYDPGSEETRARYLETEDVKALYRTNRYEGTRR
jgi:hypothetical protein